MSWHFSQALEAEYLLESCSDGKPLSLWSSIPIAPDDSCSGKMKATFHRSPYGTMFVPLTDARGVALLMWYRAGFLAPISVPQVKKRVSKAKQADSGWKWPGSFAKYDRAAFMWKTRQPSLIEGLPESLPTWPRWGLMSDGECLDQTHLAPVINAKGSGLWPTPCHGSNKWGGTFQEVGGSKNKLRNTPTGKLYVNPDFWENLMAWPIGWTGIAPLETARMQLWLRQHGGF